MLRDALANPWLASVVSFLPIVAFLAVLFFCLPRPLPTAEGVGNMPWWAPLSGLVGAFAGLSITAKILALVAAFWPDGSTRAPMSGIRPAGKPTTRRNGRSR